MLTRKLTAALQADTWPTLSPSLGAVTRGLGESTGCARHVDEVSRCTLGKRSAKHVIYLVGDSTSIAYDDAFIKMIRTMPGWRLRLAGGAGCAFADVALNEDERNPYAAACPARNARLVREINRVKPDIVVETSVIGDLSYQHHVGAELAKIKAGTRKIVVLPAPPKGANPASCYTASSAPSDCTTPVSGEFSQWVAGEARMAAKVGGVGLDPTRWFSAGGLCPPFIDRTPQRRDEVHVTPQYAQMLAPVLHETLAAAKVLT